MTTGKKVLARYEKKVQDFKKNQRTWLLFGSTENNQFRILLVKKDELDLFEGKNIKTKILTTEEVLQLWHDDSCQNQGSLKLYLKIIKKTNPKTVKL